jgi:hypothetical protein
MIGRKTKQLVYFLLILEGLFLILMLPTVFFTQPATQKQVTMTNNNNQARQATVTSIFHNNLLIAVVTLIPVAGWGYCIAVMWQTGVVVASYNYPFYWIAGNPFAWIELSVFAYVILQSYKLLHLVPQRKANDFKVTFTMVACKALIASIVVLLVSALLEYWVIRL